MSRKGPGYEATSRVYISAEGLAFSEVVKTINIPTSITHSFIREEKWVTEVYTDLEC